MARKKQSEEIMDTLQQATEDLNPAPSIAPNLSTGCGLLNLSISGRADVGVAPGTYVLFVGDSGSGKTFLLLTTLAEAARNPAYEDYELIFISSENGACMDFTRFFGSKAARRIKVVSPLYMEDAYDYLDSLADSGTKYIAIMDSADGFSTRKERESVEENAKRRAEDKETKGDYGDGKAKIHSSRLRFVVNHLAESGSILFIISQLRDNIDAGLYGPKDTRSGGRALKFYSHVEVWLKNAGEIKKKVNDKERVIGTKARCNVRKNRVNGKARMVEISVLPEYGIDDLGSAIDWLLEEKFLPNGGGRIKSPWYEATYYRDELLRKLDDDNKHTEVMDFLQEKWLEIEEKLHPGRKPRYQD